MEGDPFQSLTISDRALLLAGASWGQPIGPRFWEGFRPSWRERLLWAWEAMPRAAQPAIEELRREHAAQSRPDLGRVDPSWCLRGLKDESPAVQSAALASVPDELRQKLRAGLNLPESLLRPDRPPHAESWAWAAALWTERLVGDLPERPDPPVIRALTRLGPRALVRLVRVTGLARWAIALAEPPRLSFRQRERYVHFQQVFSESGFPRREDAGIDVAAPSRLRGHDHARLGSITFGRLLSVVEPYRVRWALQQLPYPVAKTLRSLMPTPTGKNPDWVAWETEVLQAAWVRLVAEGSLQEPWRGEE